MLAQANEAIKTSIERNVKVVTSRPSVGQGTAVTRATLGEQLTCEISDGPWTFRAGMTEKYGGDNSAPNPGVYGRAALASCVALGYAMWAARLGVVLHGLEVEVRADYDVRGELGVDPDVPPGYTAVTYSVHITSPTPREEVLRFVEIADRHSSWRDDFERSIPVQRSVSITPSLEG